LNSDLIESIYPVFSKLDEQDYKKVSKLIKPLNEDNDGVYKCRIVLKKIDGIIDKYDTEEAYLKVIKTESKDEYLKIFKVK
jgi:hypothetical protein